jgi:hypothetical protein
MRRPSQITAASAPTQIAAEIVERSEKSHVPGADVAPGRKFCAAFQISANVRGSWGPKEGSGRYRSSYPDAKRVEPDIGIAPDADGRTNKFTLVAPGAAADDPEARVAAPEPR